MSRAGRLALCLSVAGLAGCASGSSQMVVSRPVVHLRSVPHTAPQPGVHDPQQESQLLYGERVRVVREENDWAQIEALEQAEFTHSNRWEGYPGWVPSHTLVPEQTVRVPTIVVTAKWAPTWRDAHRTQPTALRFAIGTLLNGVDFGGTLWKVEMADGSTVWLEGGHARSLREMAALGQEERRRTILRAAEQFLGDPYVWGGRSPALAEPSETVTGVDCSGLVNLAYRAVGIALPRDAHEQYLKAVPVGSPQPADLVFLSERGDPSRIVHVMLYAGRGELIEGPGTGLRVRRIAVTQRLGQPITSLPPGTSVNGQSVFFGTYLP